MKKYFYIFLMAVVAIAACSKEQENSSVSGPKKVHLTFTGTTDALKTTLDPSDWGIIWTKDVDQISVWADTAGPTPDTYTATKVTDNGRVATFDGSGVTATNYYYALSPAQSTTATIADGKITANLPTEQAATVNSFAPAANISVSRADATDKVFQFKNVGALVGFTIGLDNITDVKLEAAGGEVLSGTIVVDPVSGEISDKTGESSVQLSGSFVNGSTYYFVILPGTYSNGFSITLWKGAQFIRLNKSGEQVIERNTNLNLGTLSGKNWKTAFYEGEEVKIKGSVEDGQVVAYVGGSYWNTEQGHYLDNGDTYNYEIFTRLSAGQTFYFAADGGEKFTLNSEGTAVKRLAKIANAEYSALNDGIYRIRLNLPAGEAHVKQVDRVVYSHYTVAGINLTYKEKGTWYHSGISLKRGTNAHDNRYKFRMYFKDDTSQWYGRRMSGNSFNPTGTTEASYYYVQPCDNTDPWEPSFCFPTMYEINEDRYYGDVYLYMNNDNSHYTHEVKNIWDMQNPINTGENVAIYGAAVASPDVAGTTMRYSTSFYNSSVANSGDRTDNSSTMADPAGYDYEIFVKLTKETKFYFTTACGHHFAINAEGTDIVGIIDESQIAYDGVSNDGVYRIRINSTNNKVALRRAESVRYLQPARGTNTVLYYQGNGVWMYDIIPFGWTGDDDHKYMFKFQIYFNETSTWQYYGRYETDCVYKSTTLQPITDTYTEASWDNFITAKDGPLAAKDDGTNHWCRVYLKLNSDGYTYVIDPRP